MGMVLRGGAGKLRIREAECRGRNIKIRGRKVHRGEKASGCERNLLRLNVMRREMCAAGNTHTRQLRQDARVAVRAWDGESTAGTATARQHNVGGRPRLRTAVSQDGVHAGAVTSVHSTKFVEVSHP